MTPRKTVLYIGQLKPGLHIVVTIAEHASNIAPKRILSLLIHRLQIFLVKYECYCMWSLQLCEDQSIREKLKNVFAIMCLRSLQLIWRPGLRNLILFFRVRDHTIVAAKDSSWLDIEIRNKHNQLVLHHGEEQELKQETTAVPACYVPVC